MSKGGGAKMRDMVEKIPPNKSTQRNTSEIPTTALNLNRSMVSQNSLVGRMREGKPVDLYVLGHESTRNENGRHDSLSFEISSAQRTLIRQ